MRSLQSFVILLTLIVLTAAMTLAGSVTAGEDRPAGVIGQVEGQPVSEMDYRWNKHTVDLNLEYMRQQIAAGTPSADLLQQYVELIESYGRGNAALAGTILDVAVYQAARDEGFSVPAEDVQARVDQDRGLVAERGTPPSLSAYLDATGIDEGQYWTEVYPAIIEREAVTEQLWSDAVSGATSQSEADGIWRDLQWNVVNDADIEWYGDEPGVDVPGALGYIDAVLAFLADVTAPPQ